MGYRLSVKDTENRGLSFYGTKLYGYTREEDLISYQYLRDIHKVDDSVTWYNCNENPIRLTASEFALFITYYETDYDAKAGSVRDLMKCVHGYNKLVKMKRTDSDKIISWR